MNPAEVWKPEYAVKTCTEAIEIYRIAICDDDKHFLEQMEDLLQSNGEFTEDMVVECFDDVNNLLKEDVGKFTLFMIDMCMDKLDGFFLQ